jgi:hypothetical protein
MGEGSEWFARSMLQSNSGMASCSNSNGTIGAGHEWEGSVRMCSSMIPRLVSRFNHNVSPRTGTKAPIKAHSGSNQEHQE